MITNCTQNNYYNQPAFKAGFRIECANIGNRVGLMDKFKGNVDRINGICISDKKGYLLGENKCSIWFLLDQGEDLRFFKFLQFLKSKGRFGGFELTKYIPDLQLSDVQSNNLHTFEKVDEFVNAKSLEQLIDIEEIGQRIKSTPNMKKPFCNTRHNQLFRMQKQNQERAIEIMTALEKNFGEVEDLQHTRNGCVKCLNAETGAEILISPQYGQNNYFIEKLGKKSCFLEINAQNEVVKTYDSQSEFYIFRNLFNQAINAYLKLCE